MKEEIVATFIEIIEDKAYFNLPDGLVAFPVIPYFLTLKSGDEIIITKS